jgi:carbamoyltransferase
MTNRRFADLFGVARRQPGEPFAAIHMDIAASLQKVIEEAVLKLTRALAIETGARNLCLAGGVALNCVANGKVLRDAKFEHVWIQPAAGDAGGSLGAALAAYHLEFGRERLIPDALDAMSGSYLGPSFSDDEIARRLGALGATFERLDPRELADTAARALEGGKIAGWFQGRMEFGPRALGCRSILADARNPTMQEMLNSKVKRRESFRPFAPSVLREDVDEWFDLQSDSPYMLFVADVLPRRRRPLDDDERRLKGIDRLHVMRSEIPAVTHVDHSARIQTVHRETNPRYHALISRFRDLTGCPVVLNTSFNVADEPIVCTPEDAYRCFVAAGLDLLVAGDCVLKREDQHRPMQDRQAELETA